MQPPEGWRRRVFIHAGDYDCKTVIDAKFPTTGYHGVKLEGEGKATRLNFTPSSYLPDAVRFSMNYPALRNLSVWANENVTNLVNVPDQQLPNNTTGVS